MMLAIAGALSMTSAAQAATLSYGWEDGVGTVLSSFGAGMQYTNTDALAYSGSRALLIEDVDTNTSGTPQGYVAWITGLTDGDTVDASFWAFDSTPAAAPSVRIWGHYTNGADVDSYAGSAGGNGTYSGDTTWAELDYSWVFDSAAGTRDGLMVEVRFYDSSSVTTGSALIDDLTVTASAGTIHTPYSPVPVPAAAALFAPALLGLFGFARRRA